MQRISLFVAALFASFLVSCGGGGGGKPALAGKILGLLFLNPSLRTLASFQAGMQRLGGTAFVVTPGHRCANTSGLRPFRGMYSTCSVVSMPLSPMNRLPLTSLSPSSSPARSSPISCSTSVSARGSRAANSGSTGGGLMAFGHPVGATGLMQAVFAYWQCQGAIAKHCGGDDHIQVKQKRGTGRRGLRGAIHSHAGTGTYITVSIMEKEV